MPKVPKMACLCPLHEVRRSAELAAEREAARLATVAEGLSLAVVLALCAFIFSSCAAAQPTADQKSETATPTAYPLMPTIKERPILFSGPMVQALLNGSKTQTRRIVKQAYPGCGMRELPNSGGTYGVCIPGYGNDGFIDWAEDGFTCPYGVEGERLWVRETWSACYEKCSCYIQPCDCTVLRVGYAADGATMLFDDHTISEGWQMPKAVEAGKNGPSLFMPRWASRILLEIVSVRVERLQDISEADAVAEGVNVVESFKNAPHYENYLDDWAFEYFAKDSYATLWEKINGLGSWATNPWVWVVEFRQIDAEGKEVRRG